jgi:hypothetical protein
MKMNKSDLGRMNGEELQNWIKDKIRQCRKVCKKI